MVQLNNIKLHPHSEIFVLKSVQFKSAEGFVKNCFLESDRLVKDSTMKSQCVTLHSPRIMCCCQSP